jgi:hypothetical protein
MFTMLADNGRKTISAVAAIGIVAASAFAMDQAHVAAAPRGTVEVGELTLVGETQIAALPEVVVVAKREPANSFAATTQLPEVVVVAKRVASLVAQSDSKRRPSPAISAGF